VIRVGETKIFAIRTIFDEYSKLENFRYSSNIRRIFEYSNTPTGSNIRIASEGIRKIFEYSVNIFKS